MAAKTIYLAFAGYWRELNIISIPKEAGIYVVYECLYNSISNTVDLFKVIYIGEAINVNERIVTHEKWPEWRRHRSLLKEICFSFSPITRPDRQRAEAALIYRHKPLANDEYKYSFPFDETTMALTGDAALLDSYFIIQKKRSLLGG